MQKIPTKDCLTHTHTGIQHNQLQYAENPLAMPMSEQYPFYNIDYRQIQRFLNV